MGIAEQKGIETGFTAFRKPRLDAALALKNLKAKDNRLAEGLPRWPPLARTCGTPTHA